MSNNYKYNYPNNGRQYVGQTMQIAERTIVSKNMLNGIVTIVMKMMRTIIATRSCSRTILIWVMMKSYG
mgnify:CR=1 FL=1